MQSPVIHGPSNMSSYGHVRPLSLHSKTSSNYSKQDSSSELSTTSPTGSARLVYEDIAKLNPFYKEYHNFWNTESDESAMTFSTKGSTESSLKSPPSSSRDSFWPVETSSSPSIRHFNSEDRVLDTIYLYEGNEYQPKYDEYDGQDTSCVAAMDYTDSIQQSSCTIDEPDEYLSTDIELLEPDLIHPNMHPSKFPHKKLFGDKGLLGYTTEVSAPPLERRKSQMIKTFGKKIKKQVEGLADDVAKTYPNRIGSGLWRQSADFPSSTARVSLDPATQAKLYSDMEYMICLSANDFLTRQYSEGRISPESIKRINSYWGSKNRPQVVEFHFDQATQRRLIISNLRNLRFDGECSTNPILLNANLRNWKVIVKEMSVRTFCAPDSVIRKHMHDIHKILGMLDTPVSIFLSFEDLQMRILSLMNQHLKEQYQAGCENSIISSLRSSQDSSIRGSEDSWRMQYDA